MTKPKNPGQPKRKARVGVPVRFSPESLPLMDETAAHMGHKTRSALIVVATARYVKEFHPTLGTRARKATR